MLSKFHLNTDIFHAEIRRNQWKKIVDLLKNNRFASEAANGALFWLIVNDLLENLVRFLHELRNLRAVVYEILVARWPVEAVRRVVCRKRALVVEVVLAESADEAAVQFFCDAASIVDFADAVENGLPEGLVEVAFRGLHGIRNLARYERKRSAEVGNIKLAWNALAKWTELASLLNSCVEE